MSALASARRTVEQVRMSARLRRADGLPGLRRDAAHLARYARWYATGYAADLALAVSEGVTREASLWADIARDAAIRAGRAWESGAGLPAGHPDAVYLGPGGPLTDREYHERRGAREAAGEPVCTCCGWHHDDDPGDEPV